MRSSLNSLSIVHNHSFGLGDVISGHYTCMSKFTCIVDQNYNQRYHSWSQFRNYISFPELSGSHISSIFAIIYKKSRPKVKLDCSVVRNHKCSLGRPKSVYMGQQNSYTLYIYIYI